jgi:hypothetical protein
MLRFLLRYPLESVAAAYLGALLAYIAQEGVFFLLGDQRWVRALIAPTFVLPIAAGALAAYVMRKHPSKSSYFAWIIPLVLLVRAFLEVVKSPYTTHSEIWDTMIGTDCSDSECLYEAFFTVPFVCALAYSVSGAVIQAISRSRIIGAPNLDE